MRVLHFCNLVPDKLGSFEKWLLEVSRLLRREGVEQAVTFADRLPCELATPWTASQVQVDTIANWNDSDGGVHPWRMVIPAVRQILMWDPDIVQFTFCNELSVACVCILSRLLSWKRRKWIWIQQQSISEPVGVRKYLSNIRLVGILFDKIVAVYQGGRESLRIRGVSDERIQVIYNGAEKWMRRKEKGWLRKELGLSDGAVLTISTSWLIPRKHVDFLLSCFAEIAKTILGHTVAFLVVGRGPLEEDLKRQTVHLGVEKNVRFLGLRQDVSDLLGECDIFVLGSEKEACAYAVSEALAAGLPCVLTNVGAAREQVQGGGYVIDVGDRTGFVTAWTRLIQDATLRNHMAERSLVRWEEIFSLDRSAREYIKLLESMMKSAGKYCKK